MCSIMSVFCLIILFPVKLRIESRKANMRQRREALVQAARIFDNELEEFAEDTVLLREER